MAAAVLLSDSETETRDYLERQLLTDGFEVLNVRFGGEALDLAERRLPDLVLVSELDLCARLREGEPGRTWNREVPVIVLGPERSDAVDRVRAFQRGADDYVPRPIVYEELLAAIPGIRSKVISGNPSYLALRRTHRSRFIPLKGASAQRNWRNWRADSRRNEKKPAAYAAGFGE
ncbi:MAG: hypothetical protein MSC30_11825 [Gaiellaceae bacterium MAG52_C11]|nr:hypothetical protein [Candidatus Gaiellasilicea maunaloa]